MLREMFSSAEFYSERAKKFIGDMNGHIAEWEKKAGRMVRWTPLDPTAITATNGTKLEKKADRSVVASGGPGKVAYTFTARTDLQGITAIRLEVLPDPSLKGNGPGHG